MVMMCWDCVENARLCYTISTYVCMNNDCCGEIQTSACLSVDTYTPTSSKKSISITRRPSRHKHRHTQEHTQHKPKEKRCFFAVHCSVTCFPSLFSILVWLCFNSLIDLEPLCYCANRPTIGYLTCEWSACSNLGLTSVTDEAEG